MPINGRIIEWDYLKLSVSATGVITESGDGTPYWTISGVAETHYIPDIVNVLSGIKLLVFSQRSTFVGNNWLVTYDGPGGNVTRTGMTALTTVSVYIKINNVKIYSKLTGSLFRITWDDIDLYVNGVFDSTIAGSNYDDTSDGVGPNYIDIIGMPVNLSGSCDANRDGVTIPSYDPCNPELSIISWSTDIECSVTGGWTFYDGTAEYDLPVVIPTLDLPSQASCAFTVLPYDVIDVSTTGLTTINAKSTRSLTKTYIGAEYFLTRLSIICGNEPPYSVVIGDYVSECFSLCDESPTQGYVDVYTQEADYYSAIASIRLVPDLNKDIVKLGDSFYGLWARLEFPKVDGRVILLCSDTPALVIDTEVYPNYPALIPKLVTPDTTSLEEPLGYNSYSPFTVTIEQTHDVDYIYEAATHNCICPPSSALPVTPPPGCDPPYGYGCENLITTYDETHDSLELQLIFPYYCEEVSHYQYHEQTEPRYLAQWVNPHWFYLIYPKDWEVDGAPVEEKLYWGWIREQHLTDSSLTDEANRRTRNHIVYSPWEFSGHIPFLDTFLAPGYNWIGVHRFKVEDYTIPSSLTLSSSRSGVWSSTNCTITLGADIALSAILATTFDLDLKLGDWSTDPYMLLALAKSVAVSWNTANITSITVKLVDHDNNETTLGTTQTTYPYPQGTQSKYGGSWGIDNGGGIVTDLGVDDLPDGISSTLMASNEDVISYKLANSFNYAKLRFTITVVSTAVGANIYYPTFYFNTTHPKIFWENSKVACGLWATTGSFFRWGQIDWYNIGGWQDPPVIGYLGDTNTIIDALAFGYRVLTGTGGATLSSTITTDIGVLYDSYEGQSIGQVERESVSFILPEVELDGTIRLALVNSFSEIPPLACFPYKSRNSSTWLATGSHAQVVYELMEEDRKLISTAANPLRLSNGGLIGSDYPTIPDKWFIWRFAPSLDNTEDDWKIKQGTLDIATVRPFHGWTGIYDTTDEPPEANGTDLCCTHDPNSNEYYYGFIKDGDVNITHCLYHSPTSGFNTNAIVTSSGNCASPSIAVETNGIVWVVYDKEI